MNSKDFVFSLNGYYFLSISSLSNGNLDLSKSAKICEEDYKKWTKRIVPIEGDLLFSYETRLGEAALMPANLQACLGRRMGLLRPNLNFVRSDFLLFAWLSPEFQKVIKKNTITGATVERIALSELSDFPILLPSLFEQEKIVKILTKLDQKIALNNQINEELEAMAKTLYDYWFVQFDFPDENGKPYKSSGGKMVYNDQIKCEIPEGWGVKQLGEIESNIITGKTPSRSIQENFGGNIPFITIGDIRGNTFIYSSAESLSDFGADGQSNKYLPPYSLCVSCIASVGEIGFTTQLSQTNQQINSIIFNDVNHMYFLYFALKLFFKSSKTKTGNTFANMSKDDFSNIIITYPDDRVIKKYHKQVRSMFDKIKCLQLQNQELTQLRDWLLPMLMNGQVKVEE
ncbi:restriction endonuclease subunit S [Streptococcus suis]|nr:restriction endonuclease subunit S [Streptococcus suis]